MMTKAFQEQWAAALESGKYKQGRGGLRVAGDCYCCLGVASDLVCPTKWTKQWPDSTITTWGMLEGGTFRSGFMTRACREQVGISYEDELVLVNKNDSGKDFPTIAKYIRTMPTVD